jgi:hypothetical protein
MASASNEDKVLQKLNTEAAHDILQKIYGSKAWNAWKRR